MATTTNQVQLTADPRQEQGKGPAGRLRRNGRTPAVLYGHEVESTPVSVESLDLYHALSTDAGTNVLIRLQLNGDEHLTIVRDVQRHPVRGDVLHVDLIAVDPEERITVEVPVELTDEASARESGGVVNLILHTVPLEVKPLAVPNTVALSVADMEIGDTRRASDIELPGDADLAIDADRTVVTINAPDILEEPEETPDLTALEDLTEEELAALEELEPTIEGEEAEEETGVPAAAAGPGAAQPEREDEDEEDFPLD